MAQDRIQRMVNQIATFMASRPATEQAAGLADHLNDFWAPPMRQALLAQIATGGAGLHPLVLQAAAQIRPPPANH